MPRAQLVSNLVVATFGLITLALGVWALIDPSSFFDNVADWPPYNRHFIHDIGAFQVGLGAVLLFALIWRSDAVLAALGGAAIGATGVAQIYEIFSQLRGEAGDRQVKNAKLGLTENGGGLVKGDPAAVSVHIFAV